MHDQELPDEVKKEAEKFNAREATSLPKNHELPLIINESKKYTEAGESTVWQAHVESSEGKEETVAVKQVRKEEFATEEEMKANQEFYKFLKSDPDFAKFIPETLYFKARVTAEDAPQAWRIQYLKDCEPIDQMTDEQLYSNPEVVKQLIEFTDAAIKIMQTAKKQKQLSPDLMHYPGPADMRTRLGGWLLDPRYSGNVVVANEPDGEGRRVFFMDTAANAQERSTEVIGAYFRILRNIIQPIYLKRWKGKLENILSRMPQE